MLNAEMAKILLALSDTISEVNMQSKRVGNYTVRFQNPPSVVGYASVVGKKEGEGPLAELFDYVNTDTTFGEKTWEKSESRMQKDALTLAANKANQPISAIEYIFAGDLINQCTSSSYAIREFKIPFIGMFGACSTMAEGLGLAAMAVDGGFSNLAAALTSSHFCTAERQYRSPLEYGAQRTPTAQWTVTGSGCVLLSDNGPGPFITHFTAGKVVDLGITDANNMGAAMAPAAHSTLLAFFQDTDTSPSDYDLIVTGDLGKTGHGIATELLRDDGIIFSGNFSDCGLMVYDLEKQDVHAGGSGCGCSAVVLCSKIIRDLQSGALQKVLFAGTGALHSPVCIQQGESIPGICHAICISSNKQ
jgi:stage V sporulation protein AD